MWWYVLIYLAGSAFVYGFVKNMRDSYHTSDDEVLLIALFWPLIIPAFLIGCALIIVFGVVLLALFPFQLLGFMTHAVLSALLARLRAKKS